MKLNSSPLQQQLTRLVNSQHQLKQMSSRLSLHQTDQLQRLKVQQLSNGMKACAVQLQQITGFVSGSLFLFEQTENRIRSYGKQHLSSAFWDVNTFTGSMAHTLNFKHNVSLEDGLSLGAYASWRGEGHLLHLDHSRHYDKTTANAEVGLGNLHADVKAEVSLFDDGKWKPEINLKAKAGASMAMLQGTVAYAGKHVKAQADVKGEVGVARAEAKAVISKEEISAKAEWSVAALRGEAHGSISVFGFCIDATLGGEAFGAGAGAQYSRNKNSLEIGGKLSFIFGLDLKLRISKDGRDVKEVNKKITKE